VTLAEFQSKIAAIYGERDSQRPAAVNFAWLVEELGELSRALRKGDHTELVLEFGDLLAWTATLASQVGVELEESARRYAGGCPKCGNVPCTCPQRGEEG